MQDIAGQSGQSQAATVEGDAVEIEVEVEENNTARDPKVARRPIKPTQAMIQAHELHHADYRDWCDHCRAGKGVSHQHRSSANDNEDAEFSIDWGQKEPEKIGATPILVGCDHRSKAIWAMATNTKGPTESAVKWLNGKINEAGCRGVKVVLRSDQ